MTCISDTSECGRRISLRNYQAQFFRAPGLRAQPHRSSLCSAIQLNSLDIDLRLQITSHAALNSISEIIFYLVLLLHFKFSSGEKFFRMVCSAQATFRGGRVGASDLACFWGKDTKRDTTLPWGKIHLQALSYMQVGPFLSIRENGESCSKR